MENETPATATPSNYGIEKGTHNANIKQMVDVHSIIVSICNVSSDVRNREYDNNDVHTFTGGNKFIKAFGFIATLTDSWQAKDSVRVIRIKCVKANMYNCWDISKFSDFAECVLFESLMLIKETCLIAESPVHRGWSRNETQHVMDVMNKCDDVVTRTVGFETYDFIEAKESEAKAKSMENIREHGTVSESIKKASKSYADANELYRTEDDSI